MSGHEGDKPAHRSIAAEHRSLDALFRETRAILGGAEARGAARLAIAHLLEQVNSHLFREESLYYPTIWALRPDYMSANGYDLPTTPFLDSLLAEGMYFEQAVSPIPRTTPALASLLTGAYPHTTGLRVLTGRLSGEVTTLAEARSVHMPAVVSRVPGQVSSNSSGNRW